jgi:hypothetical protein
MATDPNSAARREDDAGDDADPRAGVEARPVRKLRLEPFDDLFADARFASELVRTRDDTTAENVAERADDVFGAEQSAYSLDEDSAHFRDDWLGFSTREAEGDGNWLGSPAAAEILAKAFRTAIRIADARQVPITALWVPLASDGKGSVSVAVGPTSVVVVIVSTPAGAAKLQDVEPGRIWTARDPRILHFDAQTVGDPEFSIDRAVEFFGRDLPSAANRDAPGLYG